MCGDASLHPGMVYIGTVLLLLGLALFFSKQKMSHPAPVVRHPCASMAIFTLAPKFKQVAATTWLERPNVTVIPGKQS